MLPKPNKKQLYLISYDITDNRRRAKIVHLLEQFGYERIQYSVFTGLQPPHRNQQLWPRLQQLAAIDQFPDQRICCLTLSKKHSAP